MVHVKASLKLFFLNQIIFTKWLQVWTCLTQRLTPSEWPGYSITMVSCLISGLYVANSLSPSSLPSSPSLSICCVCVCVHHKSLWFPLCNITSYLLYCSAHYSLGSDKAAQPVSPAAANHPRVTLASASAHLGYTHCINCSTDLVNCLSAADVRKRRGESDREREREWEWYRPRREEKRLQLLIVLKPRCLPSSLPLSLSGPTNLPSL